MDILDQAIVLLASFLGTGLVIRLIREYIRIGKEIKEEKRKKENEDNK